MSRRGRGVGFFPGGAKFKEMEQRRLEREAHEKAEQERIEAECVLEDERALLERQKLIDQGQNFFNNIQKDIFSTFEDIKIESKIEDRDAYDLIEKNLQQSFIKQKKSHDFESNEYVLNFDLDETFIQEIFDLNDNIDIGTYHYVKRKVDLEKICLESFVEEDNDIKFQAMVNINRNFKEVNYQRNKSSFHEAMRRDLLNNDDYKASKRIKDQNFKHLIFSNNNDDDLINNETAKKLRDKFKLIEQALNDYDAVLNKYDRNKVIYLPNFGGAEDLYYKYRHKLFDFNVLYQVETETIDIYHYLNLFYFADDKVERIKKYNQYLYYKYFNVFKDRILMVKDPSFVPRKCRFELVVFLDTKRTPALPFELMVRYCGKKKVFCTKSNVSDVILTWAYSVNQKDFCLSSTYNRGYG